MTEYIYSRFNFRLTYYKLVAMIATTAIKLFVFYQGLGSFGAQVNFDARLRQNQRTECHICKRNSEQKEDLLSILTHVAKQPFKSPHKQQ